MNFKTIATIIVIVFLIVLTVLFAPRTQTNEDGSPVDQTIQN